MRRIRGHVVLIGWLGGCISASVPCVGMAQSATADTSTELQEVIVTAQKREQRAQDVGLSITPLTGDQLRDEGVTDLVDLTKVVPGLNIVESQYGFPLVAIRGISTSVPYISAQPTVSTYADEAIFPYPATAQGAFLDVERIEVLKGPQGTLFGQNVTGGAINIINAKPTATFAAGATAKVNNFGGTHLDGYVSGPLTDTLRARFAASTDQWGAWQECYYGCDTKNGSANRGAARLLLDWTPTEQLKVSTNFNYNYDRGEPQLFQFTQRDIQVPPGYPGLATYPLAPPNDRDADFNSPRSNNDRTYQAVVRVDYDFGPVTLTSLSNYLDTRRQRTFDNDGTVLPLSYFQSYGTIKSANQELRLTGKLADPSIHYVLGASYQNDSILDGNSSQYDGYTGIPLGGELTINDPVHYKAVGVFASADWDITHQLTLTLGGREAWLDESGRGCMADGGNGILAGLFTSIANGIRGASGLSPTNAFVPGGCFTLNDLPAVQGTGGAYLPYDADLNQKENNFSWKAGLNYKPLDDVLVYGSATRGFKAGSIPTGYNEVATQLYPIRQEEVTAYELGTKTTLLNRALTMNAAIFYYDYQNKQFLTLTPTVLGISFTLKNVPTASVKGAEADITVRPLAGLTVHGAVTYIDTKVGNYITYNGLGKLLNVDGSAFNYCPPWNADFDSEYRRHLSDNLEGFFGVSGTYNAATYADLGETAAYRLPSYWIFNARTGVDIGRSWTGALWIENVANKYYITNTSAGTDVLYSAAGMPRTYGLTVSYKY
jgi:iron complex outermembrane recepter protein